LLLDAKIELNTRTQLRGQHIHEFATSTGSRGKEIGSSATTSFYQEGNFMSHGILQKGEIPYFGGPLSTTDQIILCGISGSEDSLLLQLARLHSGCTARSCQMLGTYL
jgi:hypothetical protein